MADQTGNQQTGTICVNIPKALYDRVEVYCKNRALAPNEFIFDAISEKLSAVHQERRKKQRL